MSSPVKRNLKQPLFITLSTATVIAFSSAFYAVHKKNKELKRELAQKDEILSQQGEMLALCQKNGSFENSPQCIKIEKVLKVEHGKVIRLVTECENKLKSFSKNLNKIDYLLGDCEKRLPPTAYKGLLPPVQHHTVGMGFVRDIKPIPCFLCSPRENTLREALKLFTNRLEECRYKQKSLYLTYDSVDKRLRDCKKKLAEQTTPPNPDDTERSLSSSGQR